MCVGGDFAHATCLNDDGIWMVVSFDLSEDEPTYIKEKELEALSSVA